MNEDWSTIAADSRALRAETARLRAREAAFDAQLKAESRAAIERSRALLSAIPAKSCLSPVIEKRD